MGGGFGEILMPTDYRDAFPMDVGIQSTEVLSPNLRSNGICTVRSVIAILLIYAVLFTVDSGICACCSRVEDDYSSFYDEYHPEI